MHGKFSGWKENASYFVRVTVVIQVDTTNISSEEYSAAPNITFLSVNQAIVNIYRAWSYKGDFNGFNEWYAMQEAALQHYTEDLAMRLNSARQRAGLPGGWYINYGLDERHIEVHELSGD